MAAKLRIPLTDNLGFLPPVLAHLASVERITDGFRYYRLRHPGGIFNLQLRDFTSNLLDLITAVSKQEKHRSPADNKELLHSLSGTLFAFTNYYNAAYDIILGCCKHESSLPKLEVWRWLKQHGYTAEKFYRSNLSEAAFFLDIFNELKHSSKRFGTVSLTRVSDRVEVAGYYLESVDESGAIVPDPTYHETFNGQRAANSFNRDLRRLYYLLYKVADVLLASLQHHFQEVYSSTLPLDSTRHEDSTPLERLFEAVNTLPLVFLPNEVRKSVPRPRISGRRDFKHLVFENYKNPESNRSDSYDVSAILPPGDGFSRKFGLPYFGKA